MFIQVVCLLLFVLFVHIPHLACHLCNCDFKMFPHIFLVSFFSCLYHLFHITRSFIGLLLVVLCVSNYFFEFSCCFFWTFRMSMIPFKFPTMIRVPIFDFISSCTFQNFSWSYFGDFFIWSIQHISVMYLSASGLYLSLKILFHFITILAHFFFIILLVIIVTRMISSLL